MSMKELCLQGACACIVCARARVLGFYVNQKCSSYLVFIMCIYDEVSEMLFAYILNRSGNSINGYPGPASGDATVCDK